MLPIEIPTNQYTIFRQHKGDPRLGSTSLTTRRGDDNAKKETPARTRVSKGDPRLRGDDIPVITCQ